MRFGALDGWRGVCAILIAILHLNAIGWISGLAIITYSYLFVDFFFVLSGFVIAHAYLDRIKDQGSLLSFLIRRFGRVYPLHVFLLGILVVVELFRLGASLSGAHMETPAFSGATSLGKLATNLVLAHSLGIHNIGSWNFSSWSISAEFYTYILFGIVALATRSIRSWLRNNILFFTMVFAASILIANSCTAMFTTFDYGLYRCIFGFIAGVLTYRAYRFYVESQLQASLRMTTIGRKLAFVPDTVWATALECLAVLAVILFVVFAKYGRMSFGAPFVFSAAVFVFALEAGPISSVLRSGVFAKLGQLSYSIYMIPEMVAINVVHRGFAVLERLLHVNLHSIEVSPIGETTVMIDMHNRFAGDLLMLGYLVLVIYLAGLTYRYIEVPGRNFFNRLADRVPAQKRPDVAIIAGDRAGLATPQPGNN